MQRQKGSGMLKPKSRGSNKCWNAGANQLGLKINAGAKKHMQGLAGPKAGGHTIYAAGHVLAR